MPVFHGRGFHGREFHAFDVVQVGPPGPRPQGSQASAATHRRKHDGFAIASGVVAKAL